MNPSRLDANDNDVPPRDASEARRARRDEPFSRILRDAAITVGLAIAIGLTVNALRPQGSIPLIQRQPYDIVVPCPEPIGEAKAIPANDPRLADPRSLLIDARTESEFDTFHLSRAINIPFDWLGPPVAGETAELAKRVARSHAQRVIVYGDGDNPDSGREWARLLAGGGIKNVFYITGGAKALRAQQREPTSGAQP